MCVTRLQLSKDMLKVFNYALVWEDGLVRTIERFQGQGMLWLDGDMDIEYTHTIERVDGSSEGKKIVSKTDFQSLRNLIRPIEA